MVIIDAQFQAYLFRLDPFLGRVSGTYWEDEVYADSRHQRQSELTISIDWCLCRGKRQTQSQFGLKHVCLWGILPCI